MDMYPPAQRAFNEFGTEITDVLMFSEQNMVIYLTPKKNEAFIPVANTNAGELCDNEWGLPAMMGAFKVGSVLDCTKNTKYPRTVALVTNESTGEQCVCKFIPKASLDDIEVVNSLAMEMRCLSSLNHPNIMKFQRRDELATHVVLIVDPWYGRSMLTHLTENEPLTEEQAQTVITQVSSALIHMHLKGVTHGTICLDKIVMKVPDQLDHVILTGFHRSSSYKREEAFQIPSLVDADVPYTAPEGFGTSPVLGAPMDVWALGVAYFALLHGRFPFGGRSLSDNTLTIGPSFQATSSNIKSGTYFIDPNLSPASQFAIRSILVPEPRTRPDMSEAMRLFEKSVPVPLSFLPRSQREPSARSNTTPGYGGLGSMNEDGALPAIVPKLLPSGTGTPNARSVATSGATTPQVVSDLPDVITSFADTYAKLTQMAFSTLERAKNAATQGKKISAPQARPTSGRITGGNGGSVRMAGGNGGSVRMAGGNGGSVRISGGAGGSGKVTSRRDTSRDGSHVSSRCSSPGNSFDTNNSRQSSLSMPSDPSYAALIWADDDDEKVKKSLFKARKVLIGKDAFPTLSAKDSLPPI